VVEIHSHLELGLERSHPGKEVVAGEGVLEEQEEVEVQAGAFDAVVAHVDPIVGEEQDLVRLVPALPLCHRRGY
jgi:hypothetical protein